MTFLTRSVFLLLRKGIPFSLPFRRVQGGPFGIALTTLGIGILALFPGEVGAHHFKGLPHYNYFENYPQVPEEEFLGQAGNYEFSLVVYDFQGINREEVEEPENVRLYLVIFNLRDNKVYNGRASLEILDRGKVVASSFEPSAELENMYSLHRKLPDSGKYRLRIILHDENDSVCEIPFQLSSQKIHWGKWIALAMIILVAIAAVGARKKRVDLDRKASAGGRARRVDREAVS